MKSFTSVVSRIFLGFFASYPLMASAEHVVIENAEDVYILEVSCEDRFLDVVESIKWLGLGGSQHEAEFYPSFTFKVANKREILDRLAKKVDMTRTYVAGVTASEVADISYIVKTLANSSLPKIKSAETSLKKAGDRIEQVHPLQFLTCVFTNEELKVCVRNMQGRAWVWKNFLSGILDTLEQEAAKNNILPFIHDFAAHIKIDPNVILPIAQTGRWEKFVSTLIDLVPREGGTDRYDM
jgi:hypothetical protein